MHIFRKKYSILLHVIIKRKGFFLQIPNVILLKKQSSYLREYLRQ